MSVWVVQVAIVALFALTCGALAAAWMRGRLALAAIVLFVVAVVVWAAVFVAISSEFHGADAFASCDTSCTSAQYISAIAFLAPPLLIALAALAMLVARASRWRLRRTRTQQNHG